MADIAVQGETQFLRLGSRAGCGNLRLKNGVRHGPEPTLTILLSLDIQAALLQPVDQHPVLLFSPITDNARCSQQKRDNNEKQDQTFFHCEYPGDLV